MIKKRDGRSEKFDESKIVAGIKKAGATAEEAGRVVKEIANKMSRNTEDVLEIGEVTAAELSKMVVAELKKVNESVAKEFVRFRDNKLSAKKKNT
jgi:transcriptional regulator NrdR family protein